MAKLLIRINQNGLESWTVSETAEELNILIQEARKNRGFMKINHEGSFKYLNPDLIGYIYPDPEPIEPIVEEDFTSEPENGHAGLEQVA